MTTWVVGDIHGCAEELGELIATLALGEDDHFVSVGDLFHRGPDSWGVVEALRAARASFLLGNHEAAVLRRTGLAPSLPDGSDRPPLRTEFPPLSAEDLVGDGGRALHAPDERLPEILRFLQTHSGYFVAGEELDRPSKTVDGRAWWAVHAGLRPGVTPRDSELRDLLYPPRLGRGRKRTTWLDAYRGPELVLYGHTPRREPVETHFDGRRVALGLDTGCVYGGSLTAYSPELDEFCRVPAKRAWARP